MSLSIREARVVVALDFGTTFSGFAYAHKTAPDDVYKFYEWPDHNKGGGKPYCKTLTGLYYVPTQDGGKNVYELKDWGWTAVVSYTDALQQAARANRQQELRRNKNLPPTDEQPPSIEVGNYITKFKLHLAGEENVSKSVVGLTAEKLPSGLTAERCITDYLSKISTFILEELKKKFGDQLTRREVQWCLTVPAIWDDRAKQKMKIFAEKAGMVFGGFTPKDAAASPHPLLIILEPEAASFYCWTKSKHLGLNLNMTDHYLIVDIGGGTTDIVVHAKASNGPQLKVREVQASSGGLVGGTNVDMRFVEFLRREIGCFDAYIEENAGFLLSVQNWWQTIKSIFDPGARDSVQDLDLPAKLAREWRSYDEIRNLEPRSSGYEVLFLTTADIKGMFDPVVDEIIRLIGEKMTDSVKVVMVVGGFSASPYMAKRITEAYHHQVEHIINPPEPGCAICHGAVLMGIASSSGIISRISRKSYGTEIFRKFNHGIDAIELLRVEEDGCHWCDKVFDAFVDKGSEVETDHCVTRVYCPPYPNSRKIRIGVFSCSRDAIPQYVIDEEVVKYEGHFDMDISDGMELGSNRRILVSMYFGRSSIEVMAQRENFGDTTAVEKLPARVPFDH